MLSLRVAVTWSVCCVKEEKLTAGTVRGCTSGGVHVPCIALIPGESYYRRLRSLLLYMCYIFLVLINSLLC